MSNEKRTPANGVKAYLLWSLDKNGHDQPFLRIYERDENGRVTSYKDYTFHGSVDPAIEICDPEGYFDFVETEDGRRYFDFSLKALGKERPE